MGKEDYLKYYHLENYLFDEVRQKFKEKGYLSAFDFFCIVIWKANRAKSRIANRLLNVGAYNNLDDAVYDLTNNIFRKSTGKEKLFYLIKEKGFYLPMASAILTVLYPDEFTVYDTRVCNELKCCRKLLNLSNFEKIWDGYIRYVEKVRDAAPTNFDLRDKDRFLWGQSFYKDLDRDIKEKFKKS